MIDAVAAAAPVGDVRRPDGGRALAVLGVALAAAVVVAAGAGAVSIAPGDVLAVLARRAGLDLGEVSARDEAIVWSIRLPRVVLAAVVGASLGIAGAALQGVVRNPLADPGLVGVSSGAALGAVVFLVLGDPLVAAAPALATWLLPAAAFAGGVVTTSIAVALARVDGRTSAINLILGGVAVTAIAAALMGLCIFVANDAQLRSITFWSLGSLGAATWSLVGVVAAFAAIALVGLPALAPALDRLLLGEVEARHLGVDVERVSRRVIVAGALAVGAGVAACGVIGFVGLLVPHLMRGWLGPAHATLLPASALGGALLLVLADLGARTAAAPAELPVGILTALAGAPVLLVLVRRGAAREVAP